MSVPWLKESLLTLIFFMYTGEEICKAILNPTLHHLLSYWILLSSKFMHQRWSRDSGKSELRDAGNGNSQKKTNVILRV